MIITIDGPAASGKSSVAKALAKRMNIHYISTGALYRAVAHVLRVLYGEDYLNVGCFGPFKIDAKDLTVVSDIQYEFESDKPKILFRGEDITQHLYQPLIDQLSSIVSANKDVREALLPVQRNVTKKYDIVVFPDAEYKFYLTARLEVRAQRLLDGERRKGRGNLEEIKDDLAKRDHRDENREVAPLVKPAGAIEIDNSAMTFEETVEAFLQHIKK